MRSRSKMVWSLALLSALASSACKHDNDKPAGSGLESSVSGSADKLPASLGVGFDSETQTKKTKCVEGTAVWRGAQDAKFEFGQDLTFESILREIAGGAEIGGRLQVYDIKGAADFASKYASTAYSSTITISNNVTLKKLLLQNVKMTAAGKAETVEGKPLDTIRATCGDEYFDTIVYGAQLFVVAKFDFESAQDKLEFKGSASVSLAGVGQLGGQISTLSDKLKRHSKVSITARQVGGNTDELSSVLSSEIITCSLADFEAKCLPMLVKIVNYTKDTFREGLKNLPDPEKSKIGDPKGWAEMAFTTTRYADEKIDGVVMVPTIDTPLVTAEIEHDRALIYDSFQLMLMDHERATKLLRDFTLSDLQRKRIEDIEKATADNKDALASAGDVCMKQPTKCVAKFADYMANVKPYDARLLSLDICLIKADIDGTTWAFSRSNGTFIDNVTLASSGKIENHTSEYEKTWKVDGCILSFVNVNGVPSTIFDKIESADRMTGVFMQDNSFRHVLDRKK
ncbi:MAG: hypothetical protein H7249_14940 [Chitinophagaceae bacterium]|nr:hypothetical protein [Oligoflexus sp.]